MTLEYLNTKHALVKLLAMTLALISATTSTLVYYYSPWNYHGIQEMCSLYQEAHEEAFTFPQQASCNCNTTGLVQVKISGLNCPGLEMERIAVCANWIMLILSVAFFIGCCLAPLDSVTEVKVRDALFHVIVGAVVLIAQILFVVSAYETSKNVCTIINAEGVTVSNTSFCKEYLYIDKKYIASGFGFAEAFAYILGGGYIESTQVRWAEAAHVHLHTHRSGSDDHLTTTGELANHRMSIAPHSKPTGAPQRTGRIPPRSTTPGKSRAAVPGRGAALVAAKKGPSPSTAPTAHSNMPTHTTVKFS